MDDIGDVNAVIVGVASDAAGRRPQIYSERAVGRAGVFENSHLRIDDDQAKVVHFFGMPFMHLGFNKGVRGAPCAIFQPELFS